MITLDSLEQIPPLSPPIALTIGTFDGVHLGHQYLLKALKSHGTAVVLTFSNHPLEILRGSAPTPLTTLKEKLTLFEHYGVDCALVLPFTLELASLPYDVFLAHLKARLPFSTLILGEDSAFGKDNAGTQQRIEALQSTLHFKALYLKKLTLDGEAISSERIRQTPHKSPYLGRSS